MILTGVSPLFTLFSMCACVAFTGFIHMNYRTAIQHMVVQCRDSRLSFTKTKQSKLMCSYIYIYIYIHILYIHIDLDLLSNKSFLYSPLCKPWRTNPISPACCRHNLLTRGTLADLSVHTIFPLQYTAIRCCKYGVVLGVPEGYPIGTAWPVAAIGRLAPGIPAGCPISAKTSTPHPRPTPHIAAWKRWAYVRWVEIALHLPTNVAAMVDPHPPLTTSQCMTFCM